VEHIFKREDYMVGRTIGILGGMGAAAGVHFAQKLVQLNPSAKSDLAHPAFILYSEPTILDRRNVYRHGRRSAVTDICLSLNTLATLGADSGVLFCNAAHIYFDEIARHSKIPLINMISSTAEVVAQMPRRSKIGLLATTATVRYGLYHESFQQAGITIYAPSATSQILVDGVIDNAVVGIKATGTSVSTAAIELLSDVMQEMQEELGIEQFILVCAELSMVPTDGKLEKFEFIDPVSLLAMRCLVLAGAA
jgi:aspartate racemase